MSQETEHIRRCKPNPVLLDKICLAFLACLRGEEKAVMEMRLGFGLTDGMTFTEVAEVLGFTKQRISQIEDAALQRVVLKVHQQYMDEVRHEFKTPITILHLTTRAQNSLLSAGIRFVEHLCLHSFEQLQLYPGISQRSAENIRDNLASAGFALKHINPHDAKKKA